MPPNAIVHDTCGFWIVGFDVVEDGLSIRCCELRPFHTQCLTRLTQSGGATLRETRLYSRLSHIGPGIFQGLLHLATELCVMHSGIRCQEKWWRTFIRRTC
jgi:hypothetical protein